MADWQSLRLGARNLINECVLHGHVGGMLFDLGKQRYWEIAPTTLTIVIRRRPYIPR